VKCPAAELRGIQFSKELSSPLMGEDLGGGDDKIISPSPFPSPPRGEGRPFIPPAELEGILAHFDKFYMTVSSTTNDENATYFPSRQGRGSMF